MSTVIKTWTFSQQRIIVPEKLRSRGKGKFDRSIWSKFFLWNTFSPVIEVEILLNYWLPGVISMCSLHLTQLILNFLVLKVNGLKYYFMPPQWNDTQKYYSIANK